MPLSQYKAININIIYSIVIMQKLPAILLIGTLSMLFAEIFFRGKLSF